MCSFSCGKTFLKLGFYFENTMARINIVLVCLSIVLAVVVASLAESDIPTEMSVSLINGRIKSEGIVRVRHNATWWTICDFQWDEREASIVCRMLGYSGGKVVPRSTFRRDYSPMLWGEVRCEGPEQTLTSCWRRPQSRWPCNVGNQAAVSCDSDKGGWTSWFPWRPCSTECGQGVQHRFRWCDNTTNLDCTGSNVDVRPCGKQKSCNGSNTSFRGVVVFVWMNTFLSIFSLCALTLIAVISFKLWHQRQRLPVR